MHVGEVDIDHAGHLDDIGDALNALAQDVVRHAEGFTQREPALGDVAQAVVGDGDQRVHLLLEPGEPLFGEPPAAGPLVLKGLGHNADGERPHLLAELRDDRGGAGARAAAHAGGDEDHIGLIEGLHDLLFALFSGALPLLRIPPGAQSAGQLPANLQALRGLRDLECLGIGVHDDEIHALNTHLDHPVHGVTAASANPHHLDPGKRLDVPVTRHAQLSPSIPAGSRWELPRRGFGDRGFPRSPIYLPSPDPLPPDRRLRSRRNVGGS